MKETVLELEKINQINTKINQLQKDIIVLKAQTRYNKIMLNSKDGKWVEAQIESYYYNSTNNGEEIKVFVKIDSDKYQDYADFTFLYFDMDIFSYIKLEKIIKWNKNYLAGLKPELLEEIVIGEYLTIYIDDKPLQAKILCYKYNKENKEYEVNLEYTLNKGNKEDNFYNNKLNRYMKKNKFKIIKSYSVHDIIKFKYQRKMERTIKNQKHI